MLIVTKITKEWSLVDTIIGIDLSLLGPQLGHAYLDGSALVSHFVDSCQSVALLIHVFTKTDHNVLRSCLFLNILRQKGRVFVV